MRVSRYVADLVSGIGLALVAGVEVHQGDEVNKQLRDEWVKALRSGEYQQGRGGLRSEDKYCCLGVLCAVRAGRDFDFYELMDFAYGTSKASEFTEAIAETLWHMNDFDGRSFPEIADWIEANVPVTP
jgi:hypothetical protein